MADHVRLFIEAELRHTGNRADLVNINDLWCRYCKRAGQNLPGEAAFVDHLAQSLRYDVYEDATRPNEAFLVGWVAANV